MSVAIFATTLMLGWLSGIFSSLRRKPKFRIGTIPGPTFCCTFPLNKSFGVQDVHRTGVALYLRVSNVGSAPSSIEEISIGYHWHLRPISVQWLRYTIGWFWLHEQAVALKDFQVAIGDNLKFFPFLTQRSAVSGECPTTFLEAGRSTNGVVYFEQSDSWGGCFPSVRNGLVRVAVRIHDVFGRRHTAKFYVPAVTLDAARKYNPAFGRTLAELHGEEL